MARSDIFIYLFIYLFVHENRQWSSVVGHTCTHCGPSFIFHGVTLQTSHTTSLLNRHHYKCGLIVCEDINV